MSEVALLNGYKAFYRGKEIEVRAGSALAAQRLAAERFKARKSYDVSVVLCEKAGETVTHSTAEFG